MLAAFVNRDFYITGDSSSIWAFARQFQPKNSQQVIEIYRHATSKPYSYLMVDLDQKTAEDSRLCGNIFYENGDDYTIYRR